jgi:RNA polymerase sigma-70 factor (ECF subfamily)
MEHIATAPLRESWVPIITGIQNDDTEAFAELYWRLIDFKARFASKLGCDEAEDRYHDLILTLVTSIRQGSVSEPERLAGFARTIACRMVGADIERRIRDRAAAELMPESPEVAVGPTAEKRVIQQQAAAIARRVLGAICPRDRAVLVRFYLREQPPRQICDEMLLTDTQFRLIKSRAKARFLSLLQQRMQPRRERFYTSSQHWSAGY